MKLIQLGHHKKNLVYKTPIMYALVSDEDYENVNQRKWYPLKSRGTFYAVTNDHKNNTHIKMHRFLLKSKKHEIVDHINGNGLDNQRNNLRNVTSSQNSRNRQKQKNNTSGFKGVSFHKHTSKFQAKIKIGTRQIYLGIYEKAEDAHNAYCSAAVKYFGQYARF